MALQAQKDYLPLRKLSLRDPAEMCVDVFIVLNEVQKDSLWLEAQSPEGGTP